MLRAVNIDDRDPPGADQGVGHGDDRLGFDRQIQWSRRSPGWRTGPLGDLEHRLDSMARLGNAASVDGGFC